jgi:hypothetical protein
MKEAGFGVQGSGKKKVPKMHRVPKIKSNGSEPNRSVCELMFF